MSKTAFPERTLLRLPTGTLKAVRRAAIAGGTTPAELMRQAVLRAVGGLKGAPVR